eukprot:943172-Rhodomonas_salina.1
MAARARPWQPRSLSRTLRSRLPLTRARAPLPTGYQQLLGHFLHCDRAAQPSAAAPPRPRPRPRLCTLPPPLTINSLL